MSTTTLTRPDAWIHESRWPELDPDVLTEHAIQRCGSDNFGSTGTLRALRRLTASLDASGNLSPMGRLLTHLDLTRLLCSALSVQRAWTESEDAQHEMVRSPLFISGLPGSGSSYLHRLLSQDTENRALKPYEALRPAPGPVVAAWLPLLTSCQLSMSRSLLRGGIEPTSLRADISVDCAEILGTSLQSLRFDSIYDVPAYRVWIEAEGSFEAFQLHKRVLQLLQSRCRTSQEATRRRWILRSPEHIFTIPALMTAYPDAHLVVTHRDPVKVLPALAHRTCLLHQMLSNAIDPQRIGNKVLERASHGAMMASLTAALPNTFSVAYEDIVKAPLEVAKGLYQHFGWHLSSAAMKRMNYFAHFNLPPREDDTPPAAEQFGYSDELLQDHFYLYNRRMTWYVKPVGTALC